MRSTLDKSVAISTHFASRISGMYSANASGIKHSINFVAITGTVVLLIATSLLALFTFWISNSIARPVGCMIDQISGLSRGDLDLTKRIAISSKDEIGELSASFNGLMESIHSISSFKKVIEEEDTLQDVYSRLGKVIAENFDHGEYMIFEISNSQNKMKPVFPPVLSNDEIACNPEILDNCSFCKAKKTGHIVSSAAFPDICRYFNADMGIDHICVPLMVGGNTGGVVQFLFKSSENENNPHEIDQKIFKARQYINESVSVIEAKRLMGSLRDSALIDPLTGLHNRRFLQEYTEKLVAGFRRRGKIVGLIMSDLDYFKQVNDVHGHSAGDAVLKETSHIIRKSVREADIVIRFGGEEFLVVLIDINTGDSEIVAEKIRETLEKHSCVCLTAELSPRPSAWA